MNGPGICLQVVRITKYHDKPLILDFDIQWKVPKVYAVDLIFVVVAVLPARH